MTPKCSPCPAVPFLHPQKAAPVSSGSGSCPFGAAEGPGVAFQSNLLKRAKKSLAVARIGPQHSLPPPLAALSACPCSPLRPLSPSGVWVFQNVRNTHPRAFRVHSGGRLARNASACHLPAPPVRLQRSGSRGSDRGAPWSGERVLREALGHPGAVAAGPAAPAAPQPRRSGTSDRSARAAAPGPPRGAPAPPPSPHCVRGAERCGQSRQRRRPHPHNL